MRNYSFCCSDRLAYWRRQNLIPHFRDHKFPLFTSGEYVNKAYLRLARQEIKGL